MTSFSPSISPSLSSSLSPSASPSKSPSLSPSLSPSISPSVSPSPADLIYPPTQNGLQKSLGSQLAEGETSTATLNNTTGIQNKKGLFVVDRIDTSGNEKDASVREYISFGAVSGVTVTTLTRGLGGTTDQVHATGAVVEFVNDVVQQQALIDTFLTEHSTGGNHLTSLVTTLKATGAQVTTGTNDLTIVTPKAIADAGINLTTSNTKTLTNKRITKRVVTTTDDATAVIDTDSYDVYELSAISNATVFTLTGTPTDGQTLIVKFKDAGVSKALTWTGFTEIGVTLPTATTAGKWHYVGVIYNSAASAWHAIAVVEEA